MGTVLIFSVDDHHDIYQMMKFYRHMSDLKAMGKLKGGIACCLGMYQRQVEPSWILSEEDFHHVKRFVEKQYSFLKVVTSGKHQLAFLLSNHTGELEHLGRLKEVTKDEAWSADGFTYRYDQNKFWVVK